jgi:hypothetical protein
MAGTVAAGWLSLSATPDVAAVSMNVAFVAPPMLCNVAVIG